MNRQDAVLYCRYIIKISAEEWPIALPQGHKVETKA